MIIFGAMPRNRTICANGPGLFDGIVLRYTVVMLTRCNVHSKITVPACHSPVRYICDSRKNVDNRGMLAADGHWFT